MGFIDSLSSNKRRKNQTKKSRDEQNFSENKENISININTNTKLKEDENMEKNDKNKKFEYKGVTIDEKIEEEENGGIGDNEEVVVENGSGKFKIT